MCVRVNVRILRVAEQTLCSTRRRNGSAATGRDVTIELRGCLTKRGVVMIAWSSCLPMMRSLGYTDAVSSYKWHKAQLRLIRLSAAHCVFACSACTRRSLFSPITLPREHSDLHFYLSLVESFNKNQPNDVSCSCSTSCFGFSHLPPSFIQ